MSAITDDDFNEGWTTHPEPAAVTEVPPPEPDPLAHFILIHTPPFVSEDYELTEAGWLCVGHFATNPETEVTIIIPLTSLCHVLVVGSDTVAP